MNTLLLTCLFLLVPVEQGDPVEAPAPTIVTTLQMDPEKPRSIIGWWQGPSDLIEVAADGRYRRWNDVDRFDRPADIEKAVRWHFHHNESILRGAAWLTRVS